MTTATSDAGQRIVFPFRQDRRLHNSPAQILKMVVVGIVLLPPRVVLMLIGLLGLWITANLKLLGVSDDYRYGKYPLRRPVIDIIFRGFARLCLFALGYWFVTIKDKRCESERNAKAEERAPIMVGNHVSFADSFLFGYAVNPMPVALASLANAPIIGVFGRAQQAIQVGRDGTKGNANVSEEINRRTQWRVKEPREVLERRGVFAPLLIFPEGTCTNTSAVTQFKTGAFNPMMPVQPVSVDYRQDHLDVSWAGDCSPGLTILRMMCQVYNTLTLTYLPVAHPLGADDTSAAFAERVREVIAADLGVPKTSHNYTDILLGREARKLGLPSHAVNVEMGKYSLGIDEAKRQLRDFAAHDEDKDGYWSAAELASYLNLSAEYGGGCGDVQVVKLVNSLMSQLDTKDEGHISFQDFLLGSAVLLESAGKSRGVRGSIIPTGVPNGISGPSATTNEASPLLSC